jgi:adenylate kinase family enzyme
MNRIAVIGCSGAGKSTLARQLGERLAIPVIHLDQLFWRPGWTESPHAAFEAKVSDAVRADRWILDGTFRAMWHIVMPAVDTVVWLDFPRHVCLWRVTKRLLNYLGRTRPDLPEGCPEKIDLEFLEFIWTFNEDYRPRIISRLDQRRPDQRLITFRGPADVARFTREMGIET